MAHSSKRAANPKPRKDFPLTQRADGRWCKKIRGKINYFRGTADEALDEWLRVKDDLLAGRLPRAQSEGLTVSELCNNFLTHKEQLLNSGELAQRTFNRYHSTCGLLVDEFNKTRAVVDLRSSDFQALRAKMAKRWGPVALGNEIQIVRSIFRFGYEAELTDKAVRFGPGFKKPSAKTLRQSRAADGPKLFTSEQIRAALEASTTNMRAMILLAINGGLGNSDLAELPTSNLNGSWLDYPRPKTGVHRKIPLWPETVEAIRAVIAERCEPTDPEDAPLLFIGKRGQSYVCNNKGYRVHQEAVRVFNKAGIAKRTFYDFRRTFQTVAEGSRDLVAVQSIMGHAPASGDMSAIYRQGVEDERLQDVVNHVRKWLFDKSGKK